MLISQSQGKITFIRRQHSHSFPAKFEVSACEKKTQQLNHLGCCYRDHSRAKNEYESTPHKPWFLTLRKHMQAQVCQAANTTARFLQCSQKKEQMYAVLT